MSAYGGAFMKKTKKLGMTLVSSMLLFGAVSPVLADDRDAETVEFSDTKGMDWAAENIGRMKVKGIFEGDETGLFNPNKPVTRIQSVITAVRLLGLEEEAKAKTNVKLPFKDAGSLNNRVRGYVAVALEQGLISSSQNFLPNKPAERVWISSLLVRTLGLQEEAALSKNEQLDFNDAKKIPASVAGDVFVASEYGIFSGNTAGSFEPDKPITRAQMAAVLDRTYGQLLEENGAVTVQGVVTKVSANTVTVKTFNDEEKTYELSEGLLVQYFNRFMAADQLLSGDNVELAIKNDKVLEAAIFDASKKPTEKTGIQKLEIELSFNDDSEFELKYENKRGKEKVKLEIETETGEQKYKGTAAAEFVNKYLASWDLQPEMSEEEIRKVILSSFDENELSEMEIEVKFSNGTKIEIEDNLDDDQNDNDHDDDDNDDKDRKDRKYDERK
jgi:hypothetical protein